MRKDLVLGCLLARVDEERFRQAILNWAADAANAIRKNAPNRRIV